MHHNSNTSPPSIKTLAEALVSTWPALNAEQSALIGTVLGGARD